MSIKKIVWWVNIYKCFALLTIDMFIVSANKIK